MSFPFFHVWIERLVRNTKPPGEVLGARRRSVAKWAVRKKLCFKTSFPTRPHMPNFLIPFMQAQKPQCKVSGRRPHGTPWGLLWSLESCYPCFYKIINPETKSVGKVACLRKDTPRWPGQLTQLTAKSQVPHFGKFFFFQLLFHPKCSKRV